MIIKCYFFFPQSNLVRLVSIVYVSLGGGYLSLLPKLINFNLFVKMTKLKKGKPEAAIQMSFKSIYSGN